MLYHNSGSDIHTIEMSKRQWHVLKVSLNMVLLLLVIAGLVLQIHYANKLDREVAELKTVIRKCIANPSTCQ